MRFYRDLESLNKKIVSCRRCPRLVRYRENCLLKSEKYKDQDFWRKPVPGYGNIEGRMLIVGLAPAATGGNRTGRVFTGDKSSDFLVSSLYDLGLSNQPVSVSRNDGLVYHDLFITAALKCVPPDNKPSTVEMENCSIYLFNEIMLMKNLKTIVCLGKIAFDAVEKIYRLQTGGSRRNYFSSGRYYSYGDIRIYCVYHPSPRNVNTGKMTKLQFVDVLRQARDYAFEDKDDS